MRLAVIVLVAIVARLAALAYFDVSHRFQYDSSGYLTIDSEHGDDREYEGRAWHLVSGKNFWALPDGDGSAPPGYPFFIGMLYSVTGRNFWVPLVANALLGGMLGIAVYYLAREERVRWAGAFRRGRCGHRSIPHFLIDAHHDGKSRSASRGDLSDGDDAHKADRECPVVDSLWIALWHQRFLCAGTSSFCLWRSSRGTCCTGAIPGYGVKHCRFSSAHLSWCFRSRWSASPVARIGPKASGSAPAAGLTPDRYRHLALRRAARDKGGSLTREETRAVEQSADAYVRTKPAWYVLARIWTHNFAVFWQLTPSIGSWVITAVYFGTSVGLILFALAWRSSFVADRTRAGTDEPLAPCHRGVHRTPHDSDFPAQISCDLEPLLWILAVSGGAALLQMKPTVRTLKTARLE